jgi:hypothetical protein
MANNSQRIIAKAARMRMRKNVKWVWSKCWPSAYYAVHPPTARAYKKKNGLPETTHPLPDIQIGSHVALQNPVSKLWDIYGTVTDIGPYRKYFVRATSRYVLLAKKEPNIGPTVWHYNPPPESEPRRSARGFQRPSSVKTLRTLEL